MVTGSCLLRLLFRQSSLDLCSEGKACARETGRGRNAMLRDAAGREADQVSEEERGSQARPLQARHSQVRQRNGGGFGGAVPTGSWRLPRLLLLAATVAVNAWPGPLAGQTPSVFSALGQGSPTQAGQTPGAGTYGQQVQQGSNSPQQGNGQGVSADGQGSQVNSGFQTNSNDAQRTGRQTPLLNGQAVQAPQEPPTEFQRLIQTTTGQVLPIFGAGLFGGVPTTFAPVENIPVTPEYVLGPGDEIRLQVWGQVNQQGSFTVDRTGSIAVPQLGTIHVAGVRYSDLTEFLRSQLGRVYRNFDLNVNLGQLRSIQVFVVGQVRRPGSYTISSLSTLLNALFASGGPSSLGSLRDVQVKRGAETIIHFDLYDLLLRGDKSKDVRLEPGDVIFLPPVGPQVALLGSVNQPAIYELHGEELHGGTDMAQLLELAGGASNLAAGSEVRLERIDANELRSFVQVERTNFGSTMLRGGDIVTVLPIVDRFKNAVTLRGNVANPGRYQWHAGMHVLDLIPDREMLVTREYWRKRSQLGLSDAGGSMAAVSPTTAEGSLQVSSSVTPGAGTAANTGANRTPSTAANVPRSGTSASGGGSSVAAALSGGGSLFAPKTDVVLSAPDIDWSYAVIERQSEGDLKTSLIPFDLGKAVLGHDQAQNIELLPNDVVTIFSTADIRVPTAQQTRFVRLEGEFTGAGVYSVRPGETLRQLVQRAGGFTSDAYLYASEFTRLSTQRVERQRLNDYADQLEAQIAAVTASKNAQALNDQDSAAVAASATGARAAVTRLRQMEPVGRIVLQLKPDSEGVDKLPDLALEDGDRFIVPKIPANVYVTGQVYSANAFVFEPGRRTANYLKLAGGPDREADRRRAFVLRADGSVLSRQYANFEHALIYPGDTIVVPPVINKRAILRNLIDVSNVVGQLGIGVAAINLLR